MSSLKEIRELLVHFYNYDSVISDEKFVLLYDIEISHASQFLRLVIEPTQGLIEAVGLTYKNFFSNASWIS